MRSILKGASALLCAALMLGCATHRDQAFEDRPKAEKRAERARVKEPTLPASMFQSYDLNGPVF